MPNLCIGKDYSEELMCPVCLDSWKDPIEMLPCGHIFCKQCAANMRECAVCRKPVQSSKTPNRTLVNLALQVPCTCATCGWQGTREQSMSHTCASGGTAAASPAAAAVPGASPFASAPAPAWPGANMAGNPYDNWGSGAPYTYQPSASGMMNSASLQGTTSSGMYGPSPPKAAPNNYGYAYPPQNSQNQSTSLRPPPPGRRYAVIEPVGNRPWGLYGLGQEEYDQVVSLFVFFDDDDSGELDRQEVTRLARWLNFARSNADVDRIFRDMDADNSGSLSLGEFLTWLRYNKPNPEALYGLTQTQYNTIMMQFHTYDSNQDGCLEMNEFTRLVLHLGDVRDATAAQRLFRMIDKNRDGTIDLHEFLTFRAGKQ